MTHAHQNVWLVSIVTAAKSVPQEHSGRMGLVGHVHKIAMIVIMRHPVIIALNHFTPTKIESAKSACNLAKIAPQKETANNAFRDTFMTRRSSNACHAQDRALYVKALLNVSHVRLIIFSTRQQTNVKIAAKSTPIV